MFLLSALSLGLVLVGLGCAPVYPAIIHATPQNFGAENSQGIIGMQMASAYVGSTLMPPLFGLIANRAGLGWMPLFLALLILLMISKNLLSTVVLGGGVTLLWKFRFFWHSACRPLRERRKGSHIPASPDPACRRSPG